MFDFEEECLEVHVDAHKLNAVLSELAQQQKAQNERLREAEEHQALFEEKMAEKFRKLDVRCGKLEMNSEHRFMDVFRHFKDEKTASDNFQARLEAF